MPAVLLTYMSCRKYMGRLGGNKISKCTLLELLVKTGIDVFVLFRVFSLVGDQGSIGVVIQGHDSNFSKKLK